ncbi:DUF2460 domain-containing protein [Burkholderia cenocepacia]|uniref:DUF2460 domain-containing protein n=1 Tax=Burkholderia cenocepacia TaxID=95486 RepID=UPI001B96E412|nr:DUF2460 domain-containing protein [Burkholderia cenocepacia]MBR8497142.1 DUF2460 domain-containing protein [Burkholderia cenocepacia]
MAAPFLESPIFPDDLAVWARGGVGFNTTVSGSTSGREQRNIIWNFGRGQWDLQNCFRTAGGVVDPYSVQTLRNFFRVVKGQAYGFRFKDWTDYLDEGNGLLGAPLTSYSQAVVPSGKGSGVPTYQMFKAYIAAPLADYRVIQKPRAAQFFRNGVPVTIGTGAGNAQLDTTTGLLTFVADSSAAASGWTSGSSLTSFTVSSVPAGWAPGVALYFSGVGGDTNSQLNGQAIPIQGISGTTVTLNLNTTGLTLSGGTASKFPQAVDTLTWTGTFDTPCRFSTDQFTPQLDVGSGALYGFQTLSIVEIRP